MDVTSKNTPQVHSIILNFAFLLLAHICTGQTAKEEVISINFSNTTTLEALQQLNGLGNVKLSYNPDIIKTNQRIAKSYSGETINSVLQDILGDGFAFKHRGRYIIIQRVKQNTSQKKVFKISGGIKDGRTGETLQDVTVYEINKLNSTLSDDRGNFELTVSSKTDYVTLGVSRQYYQDTIFHVKREFVKQGELILYPNEGPEEKVAKFFKDIETKVKSIDTKKLVQLLTSNKERKNAQNVDLVEDRSFQFSLVPNVGTNMSMGGSIRNKFSFNLLAGYSLGLNGFELGGLYNIDRKEIKGFQVAGFGNAVGGEANATQIAGFINTNKSKTTGNQIAGFVNVVADEMNGLQLSGFNNVATKTSGAQITGFVNVATKGMKGFQLAGFNNTTTDLNGTQISGFYNKAREMDGVQISGFINHAKTLKGIQFGIVNIADSVESGATIGLINIVRKGLHHFAISNNDVTDLNLELRTGTHKFYSIFSAGIQAKNDFLWSYGFGFGRQIYLYKKFHTNLELTAHSINKKEDYPDEINLLNRFKLNFGYQLAPHLSLNVGPVLNVLVSRVYDETTGIYAYDAANNPFYDDFSGDTLIQMWLGYTASLKF